MNEVAARSTALASGGAAVRLPVAHMVCNQSPPVTNPDGSVTPSLMTFRECETLFHECGHALQHMLTHVCVGLFQLLHIHGRYTSMSVAQPAVMWLLRGCYPLCPRRWARAT